MRPGWLKLGVPYLCLFIYYIVYLFVQEHSALSKIAWGTVVAYHNSHGELCLSPSTLKKVPKYYLLFSMYNIKDNILACHLESLLCKFC